MILYQRSFVFLLSLARAFKKKFFLKRNLFYFLCFTFFAFELVAEPQLGALYTAKINSEYKASHYFLISWAKNESVYTSRLDFDSGKWLPGLAYYYGMGDDWYVGLSVDIRSFKEKKFGKDVPLLTFSQDSLYKIRVYHPFYLLAGGSLHYLYPLKEASFPLKKESSYRAEVGLGLSGGFLYRLPHNISLHSLFEWWRGMQTSNFFGFRMSFGASFSF